MSVSKLGVGIVGLGLIARSHAMGYKQVGDVAEIRGVCDVDSDRANAFAKEFGGRVYSTLSDLVKDASIDAIDLILPHRMHHEAAMAVLHARKHLLIEKPLAGTFKESMEICRMADEARVRLMVAENTRYVKAYVVAEQILKAGTIGTVNRVRTFLSSNEKPRLSRRDFWGRQYASGGGLILDSGPHSFYLLKWLLGAFTDVHASAMRVFPIDSEIEDTAEVMGTLASGAHYLCGFSSVAELPHSERLELYGTEGAIIVDQMANPVVKLFQGHFDFMGTAIDEVPYGPDGWHPGGWHYDSVVDEVTDFVRSILDNRPTLIDPYDCAYSVGIVDAAYQSRATGVSVPIRLT